MSNISSEAIDVGIDERNTDYHEESIRSPRREYLFVNFYMRPYFFKDINLLWVFFIAFDE